MDQLQTNTWRVKSLLFIAILGLTACGGGGSSNEPPIIVSPVPSDTSPDAFSFINVTENSISTKRTSEVITVTGINAESPISISGGEYSIDGGEFSSSASVVNNQQTIIVRLLSSSNYSTSTELTLTIGDISETFTVTTHGPLTKFANELSDDISAKYSIVNQPARGQVIVSSDLTQLTFHPMSSYDYLQEGETAVETISVELLGEENKPYELSFTITGQSNSSVCDDRNTVDIVASEVNQSLTNIPENTCVHLDASNFSDDNHWVIWTGESGGARGTIFSVIGIDPLNANLTFLPPARGKYSLSWCPTSGVCVASFDFNSETATTEKELDVQLNVHSFHPEDEIYLSVTEKNNADTTGYTYRWIIYDWADEHHKLTDITTRENKLKLPITSANNNYNVTVIVDDNNVQLTGNFTTSSSDLYGKIKLNVRTIGNYEKLSEYVVIRDENSTQEPPKLIVMLDGDSTRYQGSEDTYFPIEATIGSQVTFDMTETTDENGDVLSFYINGVLQESSSNRFTFDVTSEVYYIICASDGFPWTDEENPCVLFHMIPR